MRYEPRCKQCNRERRKETWASDPVKHRRRQNVLRDANREHLNREANRRNLERGAEKRLKRVIAQQKRHACFGGTAAENRKIIEDALEFACFGDKYLDAYSGELIDRPTVDHIIPLSRGGQHSADNICITSFSNNASKNNKPLLSWLLERNH
jgi:5-methylcytosine-specific restriction endonuclease McrA